ncbi:MAG TPA: hypothetical protein VFW63_09215, partial [Acidimicrobiales bacterium]|nr:hypothetical protein [Acidimicrobiales bacterium]
VPAATAAVRIARAGAAGLATRAGFSYQEGEQLQLAVGEAAALLAPDPDGSGTLEVTFDIEPHGLVVELTVSEAAEEGLRPVPALASAVLDASVDGWRVGAAGQRIVLRKSLPEPDLDDD